VTTHDHSHSFLHNTPMPEGIEKTVLRYPIPAMPKPAYSITHRSAHRLMPRMTALEERASWAKVPAVLAGRYGREAGAVRP